MAVAVKTSVMEPAFGDVCLFCMSPVAVGSLYCSEECEGDDQASAREPLNEPGSDYSPVPPLVPAGGSSSCSSTPSSTNASPHHLPLIGSHEEPTSLALPPSMASKPPLHFNYRYSIGEPKEGASPPFAPSSDGVSSKSSSATPEAAHSLSRTLQGFSAVAPPATVVASTAPSLTLANRRASMASPRLRPFAPSPHASPALKPLTALSSLSLTRSRLESPPTLSHQSRSAPYGATDMSRRASVPLSTTMESDNEADDEANASAFAHFLFEKSRRQSDVNYNRRRAGTAAPSTSPVSPWSAAVDGFEVVGGKPRRFLFGRKASTPPPGTTAPADVEASAIEPLPRGRSKQRQESSAAYRSVSPKLRARSGSSHRDATLQQDFERGRRARRRVSDQ